MYKHPNSTANILIHFQTTKDSIKSYTCVNPSQLVMCSQLQDFVKNGRKIVAAVTNYKGMLKVLNVSKPDKPGIFVKPTSSYIVEGQQIEIPPGFNVNQEIELGIVIGSKCKNVSVDKAMDYIGGYCVALDMTATCQMKEARSKGLSWFIGKGFDTACPVSRFITKEEIPDPSNVQLWCTVNGQDRQNGNTDDLLFSISELISHITKFVTLEENDVVLTGSPPGMGPVLPGDVIEGGIRDIVTFKFDVIQGK